MARLIRKIFGLFGHDRLNAETIAALQEGPSPDDRMFDNADDAIAALHKSAGIL